MGGVHHWWLDKVRQSLGSGNRTPRSWLPLPGRVELQLHLINASNQKMHLLMCSHAYFTHSLGGWAGCCVYMIRNCWEGTMDCGFNNYFHLVDPRAVAGLLELKHVPTCGHFGSSFGHGV